MSHNAGPPPGLPLHHVSIVPPLKGHKPGPLPRPYGRETDGPFLGLIPPPVVNRFSGGQGKDGKGAGALFSLCRKNAR